MRTYTYDIEIYHLRKISFRPYETITMDQDGKRTDEQTREGGKGIRRFTSAIIETSSMYTSIRRHPRR